MIWVACGCMLLDTIENFGYICCLRVAAVLTACKTLCKTITYQYAKLCETQCIPISNAVEIKRFVKADVQSILLASRFLYFMMPLVWVPNQKFQAPHKLPISFYKQPYMSSICVFVNILPLVGQEKSIVELPVLFCSKTSSHISVTSYTCFVQSLQVQYLNFSQSGEC